MKWITKSRGWLWESADGWEVARHVRRSDGHHCFIVSRGAEITDYAPTLDKAKESAEHSKAAEIRRKIETLGAELRRKDLSSATRAALIIERLALSAQEV